MGQQLLVGLVVAALAGVLVGAGQAACRGALGHCWRQLGRCRRGHRPAYAATTNLPLPLLLLLGAAQADTDSSSSSSSREEALVVAVVLQMQPPPQQQLLLPR